MDCSGPIIMYWYIVCPRACAHAHSISIHETYALRISQNLAEKTFADGSETAKNAKVFIADRSYIETVIPHIYVVPIHHIIIVCISL